MSATPTDDRPRSSRSISSMASSSGVLPPSAAQAGGDADDGDDLVGA
jgi:hypothetical protein